MPPVLLSTLLVGLQWSVDGSRAGLEYQRAAIVGGEWWRLLTGHLIHADWLHLSWNLLGLAIVAALFGRELRYGDWLLIPVVSMLVIDAGFLFVQPELLWYVGFSGVLHGLMVAALVVHVGQERDALSAAVALLLVAKLLWEQFAGPLPFTVASTGLPVVVSAHGWGALGGGCAGVWILGRRARKARYNVPAAF